MTKTLVKEPATKRMRYRFTSRLRYAALAVGIVLLFSIPTAIQTLPMPSEITNRFASNGGDPVFLMWTMQWEMQALLEEPASLFQGNIYYPHADTILWSDNLLGYVPIYALGYLLSSGSSIFAYNLVTFLAFLGGALAVFALGRYLLGDWRGASIAAALFAFSAERSGAVGHPQLTGFMFVPLSLLFLMKFLQHRQWKHAVVFGLLAGTTWLVSGYYSILLLVAGSAFLAAWVATGRGRVGTGFFKGMGLAALAALVPVAPTLPAYLRVLKAGMLDRSWIPMSRPSLADFKILPPSLFYKFIDSHASEVAGSENVLFPGILLLIFLGIALVVMVGKKVTGSLPRDLGDGPGEDRGRFAVSFFVSSLACISMMLGPHHGILSIPYLVLARYIPGISSIRELRRFWMFPMMTLALLGGFAAWWLISRARTNPVRNTATLLLFSIVCFELLVRPPFASIDLSPARTNVNRALKSLPPGPVAEMPVASFSPGYPFVQPARQLRSLVDGYPRIEGYSGNIPEGYFPLETILHSFPAEASIKILSAYGVRYVVLHGGNVACFAFYDSREMAELHSQVSSSPGIRRVIDAYPDLIVELKPSMIDRNIPHWPPPQLRPVGPCEKN